jgi:hypothetical protein
MIEPRPAPDQLQAPLLLAAQSLKRSRGKPCPQSPPRPYGPRLIFSTDSKISLRVSSPFAGAPNPVTGPTEKRIQVNSRTQPPWSASGQKPPNADMLRQVHFQGRAPVLRGAAGVSEVPDLSWRNSSDPVPSQPLSRASPLSAPEPAGSRSASPIGTASPTTSISPRIGRASVYRLLCPGHQ